IGGDGVRFLGFVPDEELARLYRGALCVAYPSLYEGFGIPVLEALACGAAVVTSEETAMAEVADGAAVLGAPHDAGPVPGGRRRGHPPLRRGDAPTGARSRRCRADSDERALTGAADGVDAAAAAAAPAAGARALSALASAFVSVPDGRHSARRLLRAGPARD